MANYIRRMPRFGPRPKPKFGQKVTLTNALSKLHGLWEPNDLKFEPDIPQYQELHICMKGYDCPVLESYLTYVHRMVNVVMGLEADSWASPARTMEVRTIHSRSAAIGQKYNLALYDRTVSAQNVPATTVPILAQFVALNCPEGVSVLLKLPDPADEEFRYVPDYDILKLQSERQDIESGLVKKKKKKF